MVAINGSFISSAIQALSYIVKPVFNALPILLKIANVKNDNVDLFLAKANKVINNSSDQQTGQLSFMKLIKEIVNEVPLSMESIKLPNNIANAQPLKLRL